MACYNSTVGDSDPSDIASDVQRIAVFIDHNGDITDHVAWTETFFGIISGAVLSGSDTWTSGAQLVVKKSLDSGLDTVAASLAEDIIAVKIFQDQLFVNTPTSVIQVSNSQSLVTSGISFVDFTILDATNSVVGLDTLYVIDNTDNKLKKFVNSGVSWVASGSTDVTDPLSIFGYIDGAGETILLVGTKSGILKFKDLTLDSTLVTESAWFVGISMAPTNLCNDGLLSASIGETDIDCGGSFCAQCSNGQDCTNNLDCAQNYCAANNTCGMYSLISEISLE
jgi:hypothetical protein